MTIRRFVRSRCCTPYVLALALMLILLPTAASALTILDWLSDPNLLGSAFNGPSWDAWRALLAAAFGLPLTPEQLSVFQACSRRAVAPARQVLELWIAAGRRAGKSRVAAALAVYTAASRDYTACCAPGEVAVVMIIAADRRQARVVFRYVKALLNSMPMLRELIVGETRDTITLSTGACLEIATFSFRAVRGYSLGAVIADEAAFWPDIEGSGGNPAGEIIAALRPALSTIPGAMLVVISSTYSRRGVFFETFDRFEGVDGSPILTYRAASPAPS